MRILALGCASLFLFSRIACETITMLCLPISCGFLPFYSCVIFHKHIRLRCVCSAISYIAAECITSVTARTPRRKVASHDFPAFQQLLLRKSSFPTGNVSSVPANVVDDLWRRMAEFPHHCCHGCSVTSSQGLLHNHFIVHIAIVKINAAIIHLRVSLLLMLAWLCYRGVCRQHKELKEMVHNPRGLN